MNPPLRNDRLLRALARQPVDATPVWLMRQAGRYLPEYRALRTEAGSFLGLCLNPELACAVTLQPVRRFPLDAAILFSDILTIPKAMGLGLIFDDEGPHFEHPLRTVADIARLPVPDPEQELGFVLETVRRVRAELAGQVPLIGFAGAPWTLATYMVEGGSSRDFRRIKALLYEHPAAIRQLLDTLADAVTLYLNAQIAAGAQVVMLFDTWAGVLTDHDYRVFALAAVRRALRGLTREAEGRPVPVILFTKGGALWLEAQAELEVDALGVDWTIDLGVARRQVAGRVALQGNMDPAILAAPPERLRAEVARLLAAYGEGPGHVFNLGHGVTPDIHPDQVGLLVETVHSLSRRPGS